MNNIFKKKNIQLFLIGLLFLFIINVLVCLALTDFSFRNSRSTTEVDIKSLNSQFVSWNITWGGVNDDFGTNMVIDSNGNIYAVGATNKSASTGYDCVLIKFYPNGTEIWNTTWGGPQNDYSSDITIDANGNIYVAGYTFSYGAGIADFVLIKYYPNGTLIWNRTWGGTGFDLCSKIALDNNSLDIFLIGFTDSYGAGNKDIAVVKYLSNGTILGNFTWGGPQNDVGYGIVVDKDGNFFVSGSTDGFGAIGDDLLLIKFYPTGFEAWNSMWGGINNDRGHDLILDSNNNIYVVGETESYGAGSYDLVLVKFHSNGTRIWNYTWGGLLDDTGVSIILDNNGDIITGGSTESFCIGLKDFAIIKFKPNGDIVINSTWGGAFFDFSYGVITNDRGYIYAIGVTNSSGAGLEDLALVQFDIINPWSNHPLDTTIALGLPANIVWTLYDDLSGGKYSVLLNGSIYIDWTSWTNNTALNIPVNITLPGIWNYTIQYNDSVGNFGIPDTVIITIIIIQTTPIPNFIFILTIIGLFGISVYYFLLKKEKFRL
ncbi:MAG: SBBP repeat-containing protein [Candidatus Helarchaeota archaeon]